MTACRAGSPLVVARTVGPSPGKLWMPLRITCGPNRLLVIQIERFRRSGTRRHKMSSVANVSQARADKEESRQVPGVVLDQQRLVFAANVEMLDSAQLVAADDHVCRVPRRDRRG